MSDEAPGIVRVLGVDTVAFCTREKIEKPETAFSPSQLRKGRGWCRDCYNELRLARRQGRRVVRKQFTTCQAPGCTNDISNMRAHAKWCSPSCTMKGYRALHPDRQRGYMIKCLYGITQEEFDALLESQGGVCAICGGLPPTHDHAAIGQWNVDHDHDTGVVRGILCSACNIGIGKLGDSVERLEAAISYLRRAAGQPCPAPRP